MGAEIRGFNPYTEVVVNPFYPEGMPPEDEAVVAEIIASYGAIDIQENIIARLRPDGVAELAYGRHRLEAARRWFRGREEEAEMPLVIKDLSNQDMIEYMIRENLEHTARKAALHEFVAVRAIVEAFARGDMEVEAQSPRTPPKNLRWAPAFVLGEDPSTPESTDRVPYTAKDVAKWVPYGQRKVSWLLAGLELVEKGLVTLNHFATLSTTESRYLVQEVWSIYSGVGKEVERLEKRVEELSSQIASREADLSDWDPDEDELEGPRLENEIERLRSNRESTLRQIDSVPERYLSDAKFVADEASAALKDNRWGANEVNERVADLRKVHARQSIPDTGKANDSTDDSNGPNVSDTQPVRRLPSDDEIGANAMRQYREALESYRAAARQLQNAGQRVCWTLRESNPTDLIELRRQTERAMEVAAGVQKDCRKWTDMTIEKGEWGLLRFIGSA